MVLVYANIVPAFEIVRKSVLRQTHIQAEIVARVYVIRIRTYVRTLFLHIANKRDRFAAGNNFAYRARITVVALQLSQFSVELQLFE